MADGTTAMTGRTLVRRDRYAVPAAVTGLAGAAALMALAGCGQQAQELAVRFASAPGATSPDTAQVAAARAACPGTPAVRLQPASPSTLASTRQVPLRYDITGSTDRDVAIVEGCLQRQPGVQSFAVTDGRSTG